MRVAETIELDAATERELRVLSKRRRIEARLQQRVRVILLAAQGWQNKEIAAEVDLDRRQVALWRKRFLQGGIDALRQDAPRSGRTPTITAEVESRILTVTLHSKPAAATHWSTRTLAEHLGVGATTVRRVWQSNGIKPHLARSFKLSRDPRFEDKLLDVVGLYLNPPQQAMVLSLFRDISERRIKRDSFTSVAELELAIDLYIADHNAHPKPFIWTASAKDILAKVTRAKAALAAVAAAENPDR